MSVIGNTAIAFLTYALISTGSSAYFLAMAIGTGVGQTAASTALKAEVSTAAIYSGLTRQSTAVTFSRITTTLTNDTISAVATFTLSTGSTGVITVGEVCVANSTTLKTGAMVFLGDFATAFPMVGGDSVKTTALTQWK